MNLHRIHLRKPWQGNSAEGGRFWRRRFGRPSGLTASDTVWLVVENAPTALSVALNGEVLGAVAPCPTASRFDVTGRLRMRNELILSDEGGYRPAPTARSEPPASVYLEIVSAGKAPPSAQ